VIRPKVLVMAMLAALLAAATGCGGASQSAAPGSGGAVKTGGILNVGTTDYIDSLNPFVALESQAYNSFVMTYPQLVQYGPGYKLEGDWATSWDTSKDGLTWTFHLKPGGKWTDGKPLTAEDAAWTGNTILKYSTGSPAPTALLAPALTHVTSMEATDPDTLVIHYEKPVGNVLAQLEQFWVLPEHVWGPLAVGNGKALKAYRPEEHLPMVAGGAYTISKYEEKGTTVFKPNPYFYGPKSNAEAVAMTWYTNPTSMVAALEQGTLSFVDQVPFQAISSLKSAGKFDIHQSEGDEVTNITFNSNPVKP
jgi:peptide/nickel transport system substrate-binding protein